MTNENQRPLFRIRELESCDQLAVLENHQEKRTSRSAASCATSVCACWRIRSDEVLPMNDVALEL